MFDDLMWQVLDLVLAIQKLVVGSFTWSLLHERRATTECGWEQLLWGVVWEDFRCGSFAGVRPKNHPTSLVPSIVSRRVCSPQPCVHCERPFVCLRDSFLVCKGGRPADFDGLAYLALPPRHPQGCWCYLSVRGALALSRALLALQMLGVRTGCRKRSPSCCAHPMFVDLSKTIPRGSGVVVRHPLSLWMCPHAVACRDLNYL